MDNLTHTMVGAMLARTGLGRVGRGATLALLLAVNIPDIDVLAGLGGALNYLKYHRGVTHSLLAAPLLALAVTALVRLLLRRGEFPWARMYGVTLVGVATHPLLDLTNTYGVRLLAPFSPAWYSWDLLHIVDPWLWAGMAGCLGAGFLGRLISGEIGAAPGSGRGWAVAGLVFVAAWCGGRAVLHARAVEMLEAHVYGYEGAKRAPLRVAAFPGPANPLAWKGLVEGEEFYQLIAVDVREPLDPTRGDTQFKPERSPLLETALATRTAKEFGAFARYPWVRVEGSRVVMTDFRFVRERQSAFVCVIEVAESGKVEEERFRF